MCRAIGKAPSRYSNTPTFHHQEKASGLFSKLCSPSAHSLISNRAIGKKKYKGSVASFSNLPTAGVSEGDVYNVTDTGMNCAWTGSAWDSLGATYGLATQSANGLMSSTDKTKLDNATSTSTADTIVKRDSTGKISVNSIEINGWTVTID